jgi:hypothetical protein
MTAASECVSETLWKIKPLVWEDNHLGSVVDSVFGDITILRTRSKWLFEELHDTLDSAKAAAESWYTDKLRTALEPAASGGGAGEGEAIAKALRAFEHLRSQLEEYKNGDAVVFTDAAGCIAVIDEATTALRKGE